VRSSASLLDRERLQHSRKRGVRCVPRVVASCSLSNLAPSK
jgi:hypothetical protein